MPEERREQVTRVAIEQSQRLTGGTRRSRWKAAAFNGWHEPDKSRGLRPESVSGSGCKSPGRLGPVVKFHRPTLLIVFDESSLRRMLRSYLDYYHRSRTHLSLGKDSPEPRSIQPPEAGRVVALAQVGGLHHRYERRAA